MMPGTVACEQCMYICMCVCVCVCDHLCGLVMSEMVVYVHMYGSVVHSMYVFYVHTVLCEDMYGCVCVCVCVLC